jgi:hypothetical protein
MANPVLDAINKAVQDRAANSGGNAPAPVQVADSNTLKTTSKSGN